MLLFGKKPQLFFPRARTRFIRYNGVDEKVGTEMNVIKDVTFEGGILHQIEKTVEYLETQVAEHTFLGQAGKFVTRRDYPKFVVQEMVVNACCHRAYNIRGTEIQIKMFDDRIVFESPGRLPGMVRPSNIRHTHFSRNPKIAAFLKAYHYVKEYGEGVDRMCRELEVNGSIAPVFHTDDFILKVTVAKVTEKLPENSGKVTENDGKVTENSNKVTEKVANKLQKVTEKAQLLGDVLTENKLRILHLIIEDPYITKSDLVGTIGISYTSISRNIESMRGKYLRRVGPDKGGFWEIIE
jgi:ATP-dependent DNA helicase RecG